MHINVSSSDLGFQHTRCHCMNKLFFFYDIKQHRVMHSVRAHTHTHKSIMFSIFGNLLQASLPTEAFNPTM